MYDFTVYLGRFQLPHKAHVETILKALDQSAYVIVGIGSTNCRTSLQNPFTYQQRMSLLEHSSSKIRDAIYTGTLIFVPIPDFTYNDQAWIEYVQSIVKANVEMYKFIEPKIALIGCNRDETTYYLEMFPQWETIDVEQTHDFSATDCRNAYFEYGIEDRGLRNMLHEYTTTGVIGALAYIPTQQYNDLKRRYEWVQNYRKEWGIGPHYTADPVVIKSGHLLLIKRGQDPDRGSWAFPGGFVDKTEEFHDAAVRECEEETGLPLSNLMYGLTCDDDSADWAVAWGEYAKPFRDDRGDIRTHAYLFDLGYGPLPEVKGQDDAAHAEWVPFADLRADNMYADHYHVFKDLLRKI